MKIQKACNIIFKHFVSSPVQGDYVQFFQKFISRQPFIRKHCYLDHSYPGGLAFFQDSLTQGPCQGCGARGQNIGHL